MDAAALRSELRRLGVDAEPELEELTHNRANQVTAGIWRVRASTFDAVLKLVAHRPGGDLQWQSSVDRSDWNYWRREPDAYGDDLSDLYAGSGLRAPRVLQIVERDDATVALWIEAVRGRTGTGVDEPTLGELSYRLGRAQGSWSQSRPALPRWASRRFLRGYIRSKRLRWELLDTDDAWRQPLVAHCFPPELRAGAVRLHRDRDWLLDQMDHLPRTLAHLDVWPHNVVFADDGDHVLIDWAVAGDGALGEDVGNLAPDSIFDRFLPAECFPGLAARVLRRYLDGLAAAGWSGDERLVELGFYASAVKYDWLVLWMLERASTEQHDYGGRDPIDAEERYRERGLVLLELTRWAQRARELARAIA